MNYSDVAKILLDKDEKLCKRYKDFVADLMVGQSVYIDTSDAYSNKGYYAELQKRIANRGW